jgi:Putative SAM-dependent methyltransferase
LTLDSSTHAPVVGVGEFPSFEGLLLHLGIPLVDEAPANAFALVESEAGLDLRPPGEADRQGIGATFPPDSRSPPDRARTPLSKAFGKKITSVFDITAGLGGDAYRLAVAGYRVRAWERHPAVFALLTSAWGTSVARGRIPAEIVERISFKWGDASEALDDLRGSTLGAYFDPMYPAPRRSSALPKRRIQVLRDLLSTDDEADPVELVVAARQRLSRVVVKRPHHAPPIVPDASFSVETKLVRFDVYLNPARMEATES